MGLTGIQSDTEKIKCAIKSVKECVSKNGSTYIVCSLMDRDSILDDVKIWGCSASEFPPAGTVIEASISVGEYNGAASYTLAKNAYRVIPVDEADISQYIKAAPIVPEDAKQEFLAICSAWKSSYLQTLVNTCLDKYWERFKFYGAASKMHHNIYGGLLYHSYCMVKAANSLRKTFEAEEGIYSDIHWDIVEAACMLHDIGKLFELSTNNLGESEYTLDGVLFGHLDLGERVIRSVAAGIPQQENSTEIIRMLCHCIVSHHGNSEWGAISSPATKEAYIVHLLDLLDSKMFMYDSALSDLKAGEVSEKVYTLGHRVYKTTIS